MKTITITSENGETFSSISNFFIDYYMTEANGEFVKIYLYMVRLQEAGQSISIQDIADHFQCTQKDICRAIRYWVDRDILRLEYNQKNELLGITIMSLTLPEQTEEPDANSGLDLLHKPVTASKVYPITQSKKVMPTPKEESHLPEIPEKKTYSPTQLRAIEQDKDMENIVYQFEMYCGHTPTPTEYNTLLYIYEQLMFPAELLEYLIEYCASLEHTSNRYIEKVAIDWYSRDIHTAEQAKQETAAYHALNAAISKELGLSRVLTPTELRYINTWKNDYAFQQDVIIEACQRASASNKINFRYINGILTNWHENHVSTLADIKRLEQQHMEQPKPANRQSAGRKVQNLPFNDFNQRDYDNQELENFFIQEVQKLSEQS
ncbi:MAG: DnaD domain protein [Lachnospiraceae bacterium]|nr:DnaD domain protein [Lachnospiraceae bacterium]